MLTDLAPNHDVDFALKIEKWQKRAALDTPPTNDILRGQNIFTKVVPKRRFCILYM